MLEENPDLQATWEEIYDHLGNEAKNMFSGSTGGSGGNLADLAMKLLSGAAGGVVSVFGVPLDLLIGVIVSLYFLSKRKQLAAQAKLILRGTFKAEWAD